MLGKYTKFTGKKISIYLSRYEKKSILTDLSKLSKVVVVVCFFFLQIYANYGLRTKLCDFASAHNSRSPVLQMREIKTDSHQSLALSLN